MATVEQKQRFVELRANNVSYAKISSQLGVSKTTLIQWAKDLATDIANYRTLNEDALLEQYKVGKQHKLELWSEQLQAVRDELKKRGYADIPTAQLVAMLERFTELLDKEKEPLWLKDEPVLSPEIPMPDFKIQDKWQP